MTDSRPLTDYKKTMMAMEYIKRYEELSIVVMDILERLKTPSLTEDEIDKLNGELSTMLAEITMLTDNIDFYNGQSNY